MSRFPGSAKTAEESLWKMRLITILIWDFKHSKTMDSHWRAYVAQLRLQTINKAVHHLFNTSCIVVFLSFFSLLILSFLNFLPILLLLDPPKSWYLCFFPSCCSYDCTLNALASIDKSQITHFNWQQGIKSCITILPIQRQSQGKGIWVVYCKKQTWSIVLISGERPPWTHRTCH